MSSAGLSRPRGGQVLAVLGILLCAFSLRSAVASLSPVIEHVAADFPVSTTVAGLIGTAPPICFALFGLCTPMLERKIGLERLVIIALAVVTAGLLGRGLIGDATGLLIASAATFAGVGTANILLPPLVKKYFPQRLSMMMTLYSTTMAVSTSLPPLLAVPLADAAGWRFSLAIWGLFAFAGLVPWILMLRRQRETTSETDPLAARAAAPAVFGRLIRLPLAWALAATFGVSSTMAYTAFAWLPSILTDTSGISAGSAGLLLSLFAVMGLPASLVVPVLIVRFRATRTLFLIGALVSVGGFIGLLLFPHSGLVWLWVLLYGFTGLLFPLSLVLISIRARTPESAVVLSSFVQSAGYLLAAIFPVLIGVLHDATGSWTAPILVLAGTLLLSLPAGMIAGKNSTVEDEWEKRHGRKWAH